LVPWQISLAWENSGREGGEGKGGGESNVLLLHARANRAKKKKKKKRAVEAQYVCFGMTETRRREAREKKKLKPSPMKNNENSPRGIEGTGRENRKGEKTLDSGW